MGARVLFVGLDATEPGFMEERHGHRLPALDTLARAGAAGPMDNCMGTLPGAVWPEIASGLSCGRLPRFFHPRQLATGDAAPRPLTAADVAGDPTFWQIAGDAGRRVAVVDLPHAPPAVSLNGLQIVEWGLHDRHFGPASQPAGLLAGLERRHGRYPVGSCDHYGGTTRAHRRLLGDLLVGIERKTNLLVDLLGRERWDLFACAFSEPHCAGHWFWHYADPGHWAHPASAPAMLREALGAVYRQVDVAVGRLIDAAGAATTLVVASHGMGPYVAGYQLLPECLARLGMSSDRGQGAGGLRRLQATAKHWVPRRYWERLSRALVERPAVRAAIAPLQRRSGAMFFPLESPATRAAYVPNNTIGAIRFNLRGREPFGRVEPGADAEALDQELRAGLRALREPRSGELIVSAIVSAREAFGADHHPDVPDLMVSFRTDLGLLERCESARVGRVHVPIGSRWARRTGDHSTRSFAWLVGEGVGPGTVLEAASLLDVAPTLLAALDCARPTFMKGRPLGGQFIARQ